MKFLCDNCKAKYQIADEKVAGKTVRMKCRKCGHQIEVRAAVTETSVASHPPKDEPPRPRAGLATSLAATKPRAPQAPQPSALAGAFQRNVEQAPATVPTPGAPEAAIAVSVTDEWYVAINGVPVGPVRISELRRKAAAGAVTEDSLCWQEGLEEWRPVRSIPELAAIVREAAQGNRPSLVGPPPPERPSSLPRPPQKPASPFASSAASPQPPHADAPAPPRPFTPAPMRSNVVPLHGRLATAEKLEESIPVTSPLGAPGPALAVAPVEPLPPPAAAVADPFAIPPAPAVPGGASPSLAPPMPSHFASQIDVPKKGGVPLWFWPILVLFLGFGVGGGVFLFRQQPPQQIVVQVPAAPTNPAPTAPRDDTPPPSSAAEPAASVPSASVKVAANGPKNTGATPPPATTDKKGGSAADLSGLLPGAGGPSVGPGGGPGGGGGGGLDQAAVQRVVRERSPGVKRTCWERGGGDQKSSANINVSITVAPNGSVSGATASGDDPVIAKCIEGQVRGWSFPAPGSTSTVNIPFHFVRQ